MRGSDAVVVRPGTLDDVEGLAPIAPSFPGEASDAFLRRVLQGVADQPERRALFVAVRDDAPVGYARVGWFTPPPDAPAHTVPEGWVLLGVVVHPDHRRQGVGRALTRARLAWVDARGGPCFYWANDDNVASIALHATFGFEPLRRDFVFVAPPKDDTPRTLFRRG